jgi:hypothetical protein
MLEIWVIWKSLNNHIELEWKFKFLMKNYESACWHGGNSSYLVATRLISTFVPCWIWFQIHFLFENLWSYMKTWLKYILFGGMKWVLFPILLSLVSNSSSCLKFIQLYEKMVEISFISWSLDGFCSLSYWVWF